MSSLKLGLVCASLLSASSVHAGDAAKKFVGTFRADRGDGCRSGKMYDVTYNESNERLTVETTGSVDPEIFLASVDEVFSLDSVDSPKKMTVRSTGIARKASQTAKGYPEGTSYNEMLTWVQFNKNGVGRFLENSVVREINISKDGKKLNFYRVDQDGASDPLEKFCELSRVD